MLAIASYGAMRARTQGGAISAITGKTVTAAELCAISLTEPKERVAARFGKPLRDGDALDLDLRDSSFGHATIAWEDDSHVTRVNLAVRQGAIPGEVVERLRTQLGRAFRGVPGNHQLSVEGVSLGVSSSLYVNAHDRADPRWKARFAALWMAVQHAALGAPRPLDASARRNDLGLDHEIAELARLDPRTTIDASEAATRKLFPGSVTSGATQKLRLGHPWFESAALTWENKAGGKLGSANLYYPTAVDAKDHQLDVRTCLEPLLGPPVVRETDHVAKSFNLDWPGKRGFPRAYTTHQLVMLYFDAFGSEPTRVDAWQRVLTRLSECGRGK